MNVLIFWEKEKSDIRIINLESLGKNEKIMVINELNQDELINKKLKQT